MKLETSKNDAMNYLFYFVLPVASIIWIAIIKEFIQDERQLRRERRKPFKPIKRKFVEVKPEDFSDLWVNINGEIIGLVEQ